MGGKTQVDGVLKGNDERQWTQCKQREQMHQTTLERKCKSNSAHNEEQNQNSGMCDETDEKTSC